MLVFYILLKNEAEQILWFLITHHGFAVVVDVEAAAAAAATSHVASYGESEHVNPSHAWNIKT